MSWAWDEVRDAFLTKEPNSCFNRAPKNISTDKFNSRENSVATLTTGLLTVAEPCGHPSRMPENMHAKFSANKLNGLEAIVKYSVL